MVSNEASQVRDTFLGVKTKRFFFAFWGIPISLSLFVALDFDFRLYLLSKFCFIILLFFLVSLYLWWVKFVEVNFPLMDFKSIHHTIWRCFAGLVGVILTVILWFYIGRLIWQSFASFYKTFPVFCSTSGMSFGIGYRYLCVCRLCK